MNINFDFNLRCYRIYYLNDSTIHDDLNIGLYVTVKVPLLLNTIREIRTITKEPP